MMSNSSNVTRKGGGDLSASDMDDWNQLVIRYNIKPLSYAGYLGCAIYLFIVGLIATVGNSTTLVMFFKNKKLRIKPHNMLLINLAISDLGISVFGYPLTTSSCFAQRYLWGLVGCKVQGFTTFFFAMADMYTLTVVSVYRWVAICLPHHTHRLNYSATMKVILATWVASFLVTAPPLVGMCEYTFEPFGTSCTIDWHDSSDLSVFYVYFLIVVGYLVPVVIMCYCYYKVVVRSNRLMQAMKRAQRTTLTLGEAEVANTTFAENKVTWISLVMVMVFVVIWSPYTFVCVLAIHEVDIPVWLNTLPTMCAKSSCMLNPVIFFITNPVFRNIFQSTFMRSGRVKPYPYNRREQLTFTVDKTKDGIFIGKNSVTFRRADTTMF